MLKQIATCDIHSNTNRRHGHALSGSLGRGMSCARPWGVCCVGWGERKRGSECVDLGSGWRGEGSSKRTRTSADAAAEEMGCHGHTTTWDFEWNGRAS